MKMPARYARLYQRRSNGPIDNAMGERPRSGNATNELLLLACKHFPLSGQRLIRAESAKGKGGGVPSELDRRFDAVLAAVTGPGGRVVVGKDERGQAIVTNFPATIPALFRTFCALNAQNEALVAGEERFSFAQLDQLSERLAVGLAARGIGKGDRVAIAMRNSPSWVLS